MATWNNIPPDIKKYIIGMGRDLIHLEFIHHQQKFKKCLIHILFRNNRHMHVYLRFRARTYPMFSFNN